MIPNGKLLALVLAFAAVGGLVATGAFTTVSADRTADVQTAGDSDALLAIENGSANGQYLDGSGDTVVFDLGANDGDITGDLNLNASTVIDGVIDVTNNGNNDVDLTLTVTGENSDQVSFTTQGTLSGDDGTDLANATDGVTLTPGDTVTLDFSVDFRGSNANLSADEEILDQITFEANST